MRDADGERSVTRLGSTSRYFSTRKTVFSELSDLSEGGTGACEPVLQYSEDGSHLIEVAVGRWNRCEYVSFKPN